MCEENSGLKDHVETTIREGIDLALENEFYYIDWVFGTHDLETLDKEVLKNFMLDRANRKISELGYTPEYVVDPDKLTKMDWFYQITSGEIQTDFFAGRETGYSKPNSDWTQNDLF